MEISSIQGKLAKFAKDRDWEQYHNPKNLVMALTVEAAELQEIFQWMSPEEAQRLRGNGTHVSEEIADVFLYLVRLADVLNVDIEEAITDKMAKNSVKYPARGSNTPRQMR